MEIVIDGKHSVLGAQDAVMICPHQIHQLKSEHSEIIICIFSPQLVQAYTSLLGNRLPVSNLFHPEDYQLRLLEQIGGDASTMEKKAILYSLCAQFDKTTEYETRRSDYGNLIGKIFHFVEKEFAGDCSLENLSKSIGYNYSYLSKYFMKTVGMTYNSYVNQYRLSHACYLMDNSDASILQCAMDSGYTSLRNFNWNFKNHYGITPTEYRQNLSKIRE